MAIAGLSNHIISDILQLERLRGARARPDSGKSGGGEHGCSEDGASSNGSRHSRNMKVHALPKAHAHLLVLASAMIIVAATVATVVAASGTADSMGTFASGDPQTAYAQALPASTGLVNRLDIVANSGVFEVVVTANFDILNHDFAASDKTLVLHTGPVPLRGIAEITIPADLLSGGIEAYLDGEAIRDVSVRSSDTVTFAVLKFERDADDGDADDGDADDGDARKTHAIAIVGTATSVSDVAVPSSAAEGVAPGAAGGDGGDGAGADGAGPPDTAGDGHDNAGDAAADGGADYGNGGGCLVATAVYGSEMSRHVQMLREVRDNKVASTESGRAFLDSFNSAYYAFSPPVADYMRENPALRDAARVYLAPMLHSLGIMGHAQAGSEHQVILYGALVVALNLGAYVAAPAVATAAAARAAPSCISGWQCRLRNRSRPRMGCAAVPGGCA